MVAEVRMAAQDNSRHTEVEMRAAMLDEYNIVFNVIEVDYVDFFPNTVEATGRGDIGDYWNGVDFIRPWDPAHPYYGHTEGR